LEKAVQFIKGGFSFRAKKELGFAWSVWQESFTNHRIRDAGRLLAPPRLYPSKPCTQELGENAVGISIFFRIPAGGARHQR
jgi:hypothetical protein